MNNLEQARLNAAHYLRRQITLDSDRAIPPPSTQNALLCVDAIAEYVLETLQSRFLIQITLQKAPE